ncbi:hypothetical protein GQ44DRAFT_699595 [Phaeosphaeriaceae sp. PMI808]|nr:hypothetical protein GQ44DRAFT_699595 [Phaeosphaeriaceae sp. PMI808]
MLTLWSRAAQNPGTCRCISSVSNVPAMAARRGHTCLPRCWALGTPTSTFFYTTIFAAGLAMDAKAKVDRNRQWDDAFSQLREALDHPLNPTSTQQKAERTKKSAEPQTYGPQEPGGSPQDSDWDTVRRLASTDLGDELALHDWEVSRLDSAAQTWADLGFDSRMPGAQVLAWPANTGRDLIPYHLPPQSLWAPDSLRWKAMRRRHSHKKLAMQEMVTGLLIHNLIRHADLARTLTKADDLLSRLSPEIRHILSYTEEQASTVRADFLQDMERLHRVHASSPVEMINRARMLVTQTAAPSYFQDADGDFYDICKQMNESIKQLVQNCGKGDEREKGVVIAKICHNLLVSTASPDLHTFNILISGFTLWRRARLVDDVIAALFASKTRPNELLCRQILDHYTMQSRPEDFTRFVAKMRGVGDALTLASPTININEAGQERLIRVNAEKIYQKVYPTPMVFGSLINGVLKFAGFDRALDVYYEMKADGWGLTIPGLTRLLADCVRRADWQSGIYVWEEINSIKAKVKPSYVAKAYHHMLSLCSVTGNTVAFNQILNEVAKRGFDQKNILNAALKTTRWAQHKRNNLAPAWAADNLMIAVSGYANDASPFNKMVDDYLPDDVELGAGDSTQPSSEGSPAMQNQEHNTEDMKERTPIDPMEAWSAWVEHEVGERPKDPKL